MTDTKEALNGVTKESNEVKEKPKEKHDRGHSHKHKKPEIVTFKTHLTTLAKICCLVYCYTIIKLCFAKDGFDFFTWHPFFMTIGFTLLMTTGFFVLNKNNTYLRKKTKGGFRVQIHFYSIGLGFILSSIGFYMVYKTKENYNKEHFTSWHGTFGIIALVTTAYPILNGTILHWKKELKKYIYSAKLLKFGHVLAGCFSYGCAALALLLTPYTQWFTDRSSNRVFTFYLCLTTLGFCLSWALYGPGVKLYNVTKEKIEELLGKTKEE